MYVNSLVRVFIISHHTLAVQIFEETRNIKYKGQDISQEVVVLRDGFVGFQDRYKVCPIHLLSPLSSYPKFNIE